MTRSDSSRSVEETVLFAVTGMSPAILTETIWALAHEVPAIVPDRVVVITTATGRAGIIRELLEAPATAGTRGVWDELLAALKKEKIGADGKLRFGATGSDLRVIVTHDPATGRSMELDDIRTKRENDAAADFLLEALRSFTENADCRVIATLAGGRKTMGALLYACMSLIGRENDRLTHVLVDEPFDDPRLKPRFYFPKQTANKLIRPDGGSADARKANVSLADVPFVTLRSLFQKELRRLPGGFAGLVQSCRAGVAKISDESVDLIVHRDHCRAEVNGRTIVTNPREHLLLLFLAENPSIRLGSVYADMEDAINAFRLQIIEAKPESSLGDWRHDPRLLEVIRESDETIRKTISNLRRKFKAIGPVGTRVERALPERGRISFDWKPSSIVFEGK